MSSGTAYHIAILKFLYLIQLAIGKYNTVNVETFTGLNFCRFNPMNFSWETFMVPYICLKYSILIKHCLYAK